MSEATVETELKFELDAAAAERLVQHLELGARGRRRKLRSIYFDTPNGDLRRCGLTLRVREDGRDRVQTVKQTNGGGLHRGEWETPLKARAKGEEAPPAPDLEAAARSPLGDLISPRVLARTRPLFEVEVERITRTLKVEGATLEAALDRGEVRADGSTAPIRELELELKDGAAPGLFRLAEQLGQVASLDLSFTSKAQRGFALLEQAEVCPTYSKLPKLTPEQDAGQAFQAIAQAALTQIAQNGNALKAQAQDEILHQLRVGVRRMRTAIGLFEPMLADAASEAVDGELKWLAHCLDDARDLDVFIAGPFAQAKAERPDLLGLAELEQRLNAAHQDAYVRAEATVASARFRALLIKTMSWVEAGPWTVGDDPMLAALRARAIAEVSAEILSERWRKLVKKGRDLEALDPEARHKLRIKAKELRYACEFFEALHPAKGRKPFLKCLRELQDRLGVLADDRVSYELLARVAGLTRSRPAADPNAAFAAGALVARTHGDEDKRVKAAVKAMTAVADAEAFW